MTPVDPITLEVLRHALASVAEEMNANLVRSAYSPNIKERRDCSSALFTTAGELVAQAESIPVHLGALPFSVLAARGGGELAGGRRGRPQRPLPRGAHLPDVTFVAPAFVREELLGFVACRAHHADIGGAAPGSLTPRVTEIYGEGLRIPPVRLWKRGELDDDLRWLLLQNVRTPDERWGTSAPNAPDAGRGSGTSPRGRPSSRAPWTTTGRGPAPSRSGCGWRCGGTLSGWTSPAPPPRPRARSTRCSP